MIMNSLLNCLPVCIVGSTLLLTPNLSRRGLFFGVPVSPDFAASHNAHQTVGAFRRNVAVAFLIALLIAWQVPVSSLLGGLIPVLLLMAAAGVSFYQAHRLVLPFRAPAPSDRSIDLLAAPGTAPRTLWLAAGPFLLLACIALFLHSHWSAIPDKFPVHFAADGTPDGWSVKSIKGVYGPLLFAAEICSFLVVCACASWFGARRSTTRSGAISIFVAVEYVLAIIFALVPLQTLFAIPYWVTVVVAIAPAPLLIAYIIKKVSEPSGPPEQTPAECWKGGLFYYNPADPVVMVEKRTGLGYTLNFANPWSWALMLFLVLVVATGPLALP